MTAATRTLGWLAVVGLAAGLVAAFGVAPREATQGNVQRIMYVHVPAVWVAYLAFLVVFGASLGYLWTRSRRADRLAAAATEVGVVFLGINIATGSIWGKPTWGTWWTWDARLTSVSVVFLMYLGYLLLRRMTDDPERSARFAAVLGVLAAPSIYLVHTSVYWWRTLHQPPSLMKAGSASMPAVFWIAILINFVALGLLAAYFVTKRVGLLRREQEVLA
ncbi:MAG: cytochrome c biogenesis protein CcsA [Candidatus Rokuibacteriota bacterium]